MTTLLELEKTYFSDAEQALMEPATIYTNDANNNGVYSTQDKLYLAYGDDDSNYVTVGANGNGSLNDGLRVDQAYWGSDAFWLRTPDTDNTSNALLATPGSSVSGRPVDTSAAVVPAFELNLSSVAFASVAPSATRTSTEVYSLLNPNDPNPPDAFTLRYATDGLGTLAFAKQTITYSSVPYRTSLVVQNKDGAWALSISGTGTVSAGEMHATDLSDCEVWMEKSDTVMRKTYAVRGTEIDGNFVVNEYEPKGLTAVYDQKLSEIPLPDGWKWVDGDTAVAGGQQYYSARFDTENYETEYDFTGVDGYHASEHYVERSLEVNVSRAGSTITITDDSLDKTYDGKPVSEPEVNKTGSTGKVTFMWYRKDGNGWIKLTSAPADAGSYKVVAIVESDGNYDSASAELEFSISQAENVPADHTDEVPQTGDSTNIFVWYAALVVSLAGAVSSILFMHRKKHE